MACKTQPAETKLVVTAPIPSVGAVTRNRCQILKKQAPQEHAYSTCNATQRTDPSVTPAVAWPDSRPTLTWPEDEDKGVADQ